MNPILYMVSLFYHWFKTRHSSSLIAYESALWGFVVVLFSNFISLSKVLHISINLNLNESSKIENYLICGVGILVVGGVLSIFASVGRRLAKWLFGEGFAFVIARSKALPCIFRSSKRHEQLCLLLLEKRIIFANNIKNRSFYFSFDIAASYAKHRMQYIIRYGERGMVWAQCQI